MKDTTEVIQLSIPALVHYSIENGKEYYVIVSTEESEDILQNPIVVQGHTLEDAKKKFWRSVRSINKYHTRKANLYDLWRPLVLGPLGKTGGNWFSIFGIHVYFRYGKGMKGGKYIPLTKLNISVSNQWKWKIYENKKED